MEVVMELLRAQCEATNKQLVSTKEPIIPFLMEGEYPVREQKNSKMKLLNGASDWKVSVDLKTSQQFPVPIIQTEKQPDIVTWSNSKKSVHLIELTVPSEENWEDAHERKKNRYEILRADCVEKGCRSFLGHSVISFLSKIGITGRSLKVASDRLQTTVQYASSWIWP